MINQVEKKYFHSTGIFSLDTSLVSDGYLSSGKIFSEFFDMSELHISSSELHTSTSINSVVFI